MFSGVAGTAYRAGHSYHFKFVTQGKPGEATGPT